MTNATLAAAAANVIVLTADEHAFIMAQRSAGFVTEPVVAVEKPLSKAAIFIDKMESFIDRKVNRRAGTYPLAKVKTSRGERGVFWVGMYKDELSVGVCKITDGGRLYKPNKYDGSCFILATELAAMNS